MPPEVTYEALQADVQAHLGIGRDRLGGVLTSLAGAGKRLPREVEDPIGWGQGPASIRSQSDA